LGQVHLINFRHVMAQGGIFLGGSMAPTKQELRKKDLAELDTVDSSIFPPKGESTEKFKRWKNGPDGIPRAVEKTIKRGAMVPNKMGKKR